MDSANHVDPANKGNIDLTWFGHSSFRLTRGGTSLFFDPVRKNDLLKTTFDTKCEPGPDAIFISHEHWDHCDPQTIMELSKGATKIYGPLAIENPIVHWMSFEVPDHKKLLENQKRINVINEGDIIIIDKFSIKSLKAQEGLSYLISTENKGILFMGDSTTTKEMIEEDPDIVLFPIWAVVGEGSNIEEFHVLARNRLSIPMHYHTSVDALPNFHVDLNGVKDLLKEIELKILERNVPLGI